MIPIEAMENQFSMSWRRLSINIFLIYCQKARIALLRYSQFCDFNSYYYMERTLHSFSLVSGLCKRMLHKCVRKALLIVCTEFQPAQKPNGRSLLWWEDSSNEFVNELCCWNDCNCKILDKSKTIVSVKRSDPLEYLDASFHGHDLMS